MKTLNKIYALIGSLLILISLQPLVSWAFPYNLGGLWLIILGMSLVIYNIEDWRRLVEKKLSFRPKNLFRYPRLPYFQVLVLLLLFFLALFTIRPMVLMFALIILALTQSYLIILKQNFQDEMKVKTVFQIQVFTYTSLFIYSNFHRFYLIGDYSEYLASLFIILAWLIELFYLYIKIFK